MRRQTFCRAASLREIRPAGADAGAAPTAVENAGGSLDSPDSWCQGQRRLRPLARRRASNRRPLFVAMRARKPWVRARCKLLGLKVRFIALLEQKPQAKSMAWELYERRQGY